MIASRLEVIEVGIDPDGEPIKSCVVVAVDAPPSRDTAKAARLPRAAQTALRSLSEALDEQDEPAQPSRHIPNGAKVVSVAAWREQTSPPRDQHLRLGKAFHFMIAPRLRLPCRERRKSAFLKFGVSPGLEFFEILGTILSLSLSRSFWAPFLAGDTAPAGLRTVRRGRRNLITSSFSLLDRI